MANQLLDALKLRRVIVVSTGGAPQTVGTLTLPFNNLQVTVTNASTTILAANANRHYLLVQNNDPSGIIYIAFAIAATTVSGLKILPGASYELDPNCSSDAINAIGSLVSTNNVIIVWA
jgi:hypothetical protein